MEEVTYESLLSEWIDHNLSSFSDEITLFDYQQNALKSAIKFLHYYFESLQKYDAEENYFLSLLSPEYESKGCSTDER